MNNQVLQFRSPNDFSDNILLSNSENQKRSVSYALIPKLILVEVNNNNVTFDFKYPINEKATTTYCQSGIEFILAENTKKIIKVIIPLDNVEGLKAKLDDFDTSFRYLRLKQYRESIKGNYDLAHKFIHHFANDVFEEKL